MGARPKAQDKTCQKIISTAQEISIVHVAGKCKIRLPKQRPPGNDGQNEAEDAYGKGQKMGGPSHIQLVLLSYVSLSTGDDCY